MFCLADVSWVEFIAFDKGGVNDAVMLMYIFACLWAGLVIDLWIDFDEILWEDAVLDEKDARWTFGNCLIVGNPDCRITGTSNTFQYRICMADCWEWSKIVSRIEIFFPISSVFGVVLLSSDVCALLIVLVVGIWVVYSLRQWLQLGFD